MFFFSAKCEIWYFAYGSSLYSCCMNLYNIFTNLIQDTWNVYEWFVYNSAKADAENFRLTILGNIGLHTLQIGDITTKSVSSSALLGITIDSKLNFKEDVSNVIKKSIL